MRYLRQHAVLIAASLAAMASLAGVFFLNSNAEEKLSPIRVAQVPTPSIALDTQPSETSSAPVEEAPVSIEASDILHLNVSAISLDVKVSGETFPRQTENCNGGDYCIDPPVPDQAAWYGKTPSVPSVNPVLLFGHTSWRNPEYATFNNLPAMKAGDEIIVTTKTGVFTYTAQAPTLVPYDVAPQSEVIFGDETEKLVLVTCNNEKGAATVVVAHLTTAFPA